MISGKLYYDEESLRHFQDHPTDPVYREWAQQIVQTVTHSESTAFDPHSR